MQAERFALATRPGLCGFVGVSCIWSAMARASQARTCPHLTHYLATMNFYRDFAYAEIGCDLLGFTALPQRTP